MDMSEEKKPAITDIRTVCFDTANKTISIGMGYSGIEATGDALLPVNGHQQYPGNWDAAEYAANVIAALKGCEARMRRHNGLVVYTFEERAS